MADFTNLKADFNSGGDHEITTNGNQEITGERLNYVLNNIVDTVNNTKQDSEFGKGLSSNDYTNAEKTKLAQLPTRNILDKEFYKKADKDGVIAFAKDIVSREDGIGAEFIRRRSAGQLHIGDGSAFMRSIKGKSLVWNQMVDVNQFFFPTTTEGITFTKGGSGEIIANGTATAAAFINISLNVQQGHKYLIKGCPAGGEDHYAVYTTNKLNLWDRGGGGTAIAEASGVTYFIGAYITAGSTANNLVFRPQLFDLTQMFGAGNEPSTAAEFEALFPLPYYPYNAGEIVNLKATKLLTNGFNQWDEEWANGAYDIVTGEAYDEPTRIRAKNFIPVMPNCTYYCKNGGSGDVWALFYDAAKNVISGHITGITYSGNASMIKNTTFTTPANCAYMAFYVAAEYGAIYHHDICINFSNASLNGTYKPYEEHELTLPAGLTKTYTGADGQTHTWQGLDSAGSAYDEQTPTKNIQRIGVVDLGALDLGRQDSGEVHGFRGTLQNMKRPANSEVPNFLVKGYSPVPYNAVWGNKNVTIDGNANIVFLDNAYDTAAEFKAAMAGVLLFYELAEPIETEVPARNFNYFISDMGQEWILPEGVDEQGVPLTAPFNAVIAYASNVRDTIFHLPENYLSKESTIALLEAMKSANLIASYTMTFDTANNKYSFTITKAS